MGHPVWAEVDLRALAHNLREVRRLVGRRKIMAVVKANAYGHGMTEVARALLAAGADWLGVARGTEALELRSEGITAPILVLGYVDPGECPAILSAGVHVTVYDLHTAEVLAGAAQREGKSLRVHIKVDTGMGRLGLPCDVSGVKAALAVADLAGVKVEGLFTHFACADDPDESPVRWQIDRFLNFARQLEREGLTISCKHAANSAAVMRLPESHFDMVRPGIMLYGLHPSPVTFGKAELHPVMSLKARVAQVKRVAAGFPVSYGWTYKTSGPTVLATVAVGYGDGYSRLLSGQGEVLVGGKRAPVVGRVCMDHIIVDVTQVESVTAGDEVVLFGRQGAASLPVEEIAEKMGTINYEVVCAVGARVPRVYL
ncbi:MAG: alanine racemase [Bacillota bacterium]